MTIHDEQYKAMKRRIANQRKKKHGWMSGFVIAPKSANAGPRELRPYNFEKMDRVIKS